MAQDDRTKSPVARRRLLLASAMIAVAAPHAKADTVGTSGSVPMSAPSGAAHVPKPHPGRLTRVLQRINARQKLNISAFGSSSTEGVGASTLAHSYPSRLEVELTAMLPGGVKVANRGIGGEDVDDMMRRLPRVIAEQPDLIIWQTGTNDPLRDVPLARFVAETRQGIAAMQAAGIDVMMMEPQLCRRISETPGALRFRDAVRDIGASMHVPVIRRYAMMQDWLARKALTEDEMLSPDGLHMADAGYALLAKRVAEMVTAGAAPGRVLTAAR